MLSRIIAISVITTMVVMFSLYHKLQVANQRAEDFKEMVTWKEGEAERWKDKEGKDHAQFDVIAVNNAANLKHDSLIVALTKEVAKLKHIKSVSHTATETKEQIITTLRDSITVSKDTIRCINYDSKWFSINGCFDGSDTVNAIMRDTITQVIFEGKRTKKFLFFRYGKRDYRSDIKSQNPGSKIIVNKTIVIKE